MTKTISVMAAVLGLSTAALASGSFQWEFATTPDSTLLLLGDAKLDSGKLSLGTSGLLVRNGYRQPQGAFSIEARVRLSQYGPQSERWISDLFNTATWNHVYGDSSQGITFRIGGGELYPPLAQDTDQASLTWLDHNRRALLSNCLGDFVIGTGDASWKEVYTNRCVELGRWIHFVAVYDGQSMSVWLDGKNVTDTSRIVHAASVPVRDTFVVLNVGGRSASLYDDPRHFFGDVDFLRVVDSAFSPSEIRERYRALPAVDTTSCVPVLRVVSPRPGEVVTSQTRLKLRLDVPVSCRDTALSDTIFGAGDSVEIDIATSPSFDTLRERSLAVLDTPIVSLLDSQGLDAYLRARLVRHGAAPHVAARAAATSVAGEWSGVTPITSLVARSAGVAARSLNGASAVRWSSRGGFVLGASQPISLQDVQGHAVSFHVEGNLLVPDHSLAAGVYVLSTNAGACRALVPVR